MTSPHCAEAVLSSVIEVIGADGSVLQRVKLLPYGTFRGRDGRGPWVLEGQTHAQEVIAATRQFQGSADMMFDYDHQSALAAVPGVGGTAKAAGWIKLDTLAAEHDGIYANVDWTPPAVAALKAREYRYHSPHFRVQKGTGRVTRLVNAGLTNSPNLDLPALASQVPASSLSVTAHTKLTDDERAACSMLGLGETEFLKAKKMEALDNDRNDARNLLTDAEIMACEMTGMSPQAFINARDQEANRQRIAAQLTEDEIRACEMTGTSPEAFVSYRDQEANRQRAIAQLTKDELRACEMTGMRPEDYIKARERN